jgi:hypothetical protein
LEFLNSEEKNHGELYFGFFFVLNLVSEVDVMTVKIDKTNSKDLSKIIAEKLGKRKKNGNLAKHFGKLKRKIDGLEYQQELRKDED